jgi:hypothetical protein
MDGPIWTEAMGQGGISYACAPWRSGRAGRAARGTPNSSVSVPPESHGANQAFVCSPNATFATRFLDFNLMHSYDRRMMARAAVAIVVMMASAGWVQAQSLAEVARAEAERRKTVSAPGKVYTNNDLRPDFTRPPSAAPAAAPATGGDLHPTSGDAAAAPAASAGQGAAPAAAEGAGPVRDQAYWSARVTDARAKVERSKAFAQALQNRIDMLWTDFVNRGDPVQQRAIEQDRNKALTELEAVKREIETNTKAVADIEEEARRAGVPAGWLR